MLADGRAVSTASEAVRTGGECTGEVTFRMYGMPAGQEPMQPSALPADPDAPADPVRQPADQAAPQPPGEPSDAQADPDAPADEPAIEVPQPPPPPPADPDTPADGQPMDEAPPATEDTAPEDDDDGGCLIATAAHGTELAPQVQLLREVRDTTLLSTESGRAFMSAFSQAYYAFSPQVADLERSHPALRQAAAALVAPMLYALSVVEAAEPGSERDVVAYGALAIALVAGMYVAAPAAGAWYAARVVRARLRATRA